MISIISFSVNCHSKVMIFCEFNIDNTLSFLSFYRYRRLCSDNRKYHNGNGECSGRCVPISQAQKIYLSGFSHIDFVRWGGTEQRWLKALENSLTLGLDPYVLICLQDNRLLSMDLRVY